MTKDNSVGNENPERKEYAQMPVDARYRNLYPEWEVVGEPYEDRVPGSEDVRELITIRKRIENK